MKRIPIRVLVVVVCLFIIGNGPASAQSNCAPISGTVHGAFYKAVGETSRAWHMVGNFTIGKDLFFATVTVKSTSMHQEPDIWQGTETWTFDFGDGSTNPADDRLRHGAHGRPHDRRDCPHS